MVGGNILSQLLSLVVSHPGQGLPGLLSVVTGLGSYDASRRAADVAQQATQRGTQAGTRGPADPLIPGSTTGIDAIDQSGQSGEIIGLLNELAGYSPQGGALLAQYAENSRALNAQRGFADRVLGLAENSGLKGLAGQTATLRADTLEKLDAARANPAATRSRAAGTEARRDELLSGVKSAADEAGTYFRNVRDNPTVFSTADIERMAGEFADQTRAGEALDTARLESSAAAQGLAPGAVAALKTQLGANSAAANAGNRRDLLVKNAVASSGRADQAATTLANLLDQAAKTATGVDTGFSTLAEGQYTAANELDKALVEDAATLGDTLLKTEGGLTGAYEGNLTNALTARGALEQPENFFTIGSLLDTVNRYNVALRTGSLAEQSQALAGLMQAVLGEYDAARTAQVSRAEAAAMQTAANWGPFSSIFGGLTGMAGQLGGAGILGSALKAKP